MIERLIAFNTVSRDSNLGLIEWARDYLHQPGATTRLTHDASGKKANLFATLGDSKKPGLILSGHTDVVPVDGQNWDTDPFVAVERDGKLFARGSADMKGFIGIMLAQAPKFVAALNANRLDAPLHYALSYDEEVGCLGVRGLIRDLEENGIRPAGCVVGEPTSMQPIIAHKGTHRFRCAVHGREAHSSYVTYGVNAIEYAARLVVYIRQIADRLAQFEKRDYGFTVPYSTLSTGVIRGGIAANVMPKDCEFQFDMRTLPQASPMRSIRKSAPMRKSWRAKCRRSIRRRASTWCGPVRRSGWPRRKPTPSCAGRCSCREITTVGKVSYGTEAGLFQKMGVPTRDLRPGRHRPGASAQ